MNKTLSFLTAAAAMILLSACTQAPSCAAPYLVTKIEDGKTTYYRISAAYDTAQSACVETGEILTKEEYENAKQQ